jgi:hypothetical protein
MIEMKGRKLLIALSAIVGAIGLSGATARAENVILKEASRPSSYCHLKFQAIQESTLANARPSLAPSGDLIDFYGSCDHDPLGSDEVQAQRIESQHRFAIDYED